MPRFPSLPALFAGLLLLTATPVFPGDAGPHDPAGALPASVAEKGIPPTAGEGDQAGFADPSSEPEAPGNAEAGPVPALSDPLEPVNRALFVVNDKAYFWVLKPVAQGYRAVVPELVRVSVRNFFLNITMPVRFANNLLQGKIRNSGVELLRFAINTTAGIGGLFDPAKNDFHIEPRDEDLGQTLGTYGIGHGMYVVLPLLGPTSLRDGVGRAGDSFLDPVGYAGDTEFVIGMKAFQAENEISLRIGEYEDLKKSSLDPYVAVRDAYSQYRAKKVRE